MHQNFIYRSIELKAADSIKTVLRLSLRHLASGSCGMFPWYLTMFQLSCYAVQYTAL